MRSLLLFLSFLLACSSEPKNETVNHSGLMDSAKIVLEQEMVADDSKLENDFPKEPNNQSDTLYADSSQVVFVTPTDEEVEVMRQENGEDAFQEILSDVLYYEFEAQEFLVAQRIPYVMTDKRFIHFIGKDEHYVIDTDEYEMKWSVVYFDGISKPRFFSHVDIQSELGVEETSF